MSGIPAYIWFGRAEASNIHGVENMWTVWRQHKQNYIIGLAHSIRSKEKWLLWPSYKISIGSDESRPWTCFMKWSWRFSLKTSAFDHPEAVTVPAASGLLSFIKSGIIRCTGKIKKGGIWLPTTFLAPITVTVWSSTHYHLGLVTLCSAFILYLCPSNLCYMLLWLVS